MVIYGFDVIFSPWLDVGAYNNLLQVSKHSMHPITARGISPTAEAKFSATIQVHEDCAVTFKATNKLFEYLLVSKVLNKSRLLGHSNGLV
jgi:hypothetical protein